jgi:hypothetical protein
MLHQQQSFQLLLPALLVKQSFLAELVRQHSNQFQRRTERQRL